MDSKEETLSALSPEGPQEKSKTNKDGEARTHTHTHTSLSNKKREWASPGLTTNPEVPKTN